MALLDIVYNYSGDPVPPPGCALRRRTAEEMRNYINGLVIEIKGAGISVDFSSKKIGEGKSAVLINGVSVNDILADLEIRRPEVENPSPGESLVSGFTRDPEDWNTDYVEDISDLLMKNAISKAYANAIGSRAV